MDSEPSRRLPPLRFAGSVEEARRAILEVLEVEPRARVVEVDNDYIHAEFTSLILRFVDDVEFAIDTNGRQVHFRSVSRVGYSDLGVNRRRMKRLCQRFAEKKHSVG